MTINIFKGKFIVVDGPDATGKTTAIPKVADRLRDQGYAVLEVKDPGTTELGLQLRSIVLNTTMASFTQLLLFVAAREELMQQVVLPALEANKVVICDRYFYSTYVYQGILKGLVKEAHILKLLSASAVTPDLTLILDVSVETALKRMATRTDNNHFDQLDIETKELIRRSYLDFQKTNPEVTVIDTERDINEVHDDIYNHILNLVRS